MIDIKPTPPPHARWISSAAADLFSRTASRPQAVPAELEARRAHYDAINAARLEEALRRYPVAVAVGEVGGVPVHDVRPACRPIAGTLVCLHGGAFLWGSGAGAVLEAVPVAASTGMRVVAVNYALAPEHPFPRAVEDVLAVLAALRGSGAGALGIYGCSAGAYLAAQVVARLIADGEPGPGAMAMLHGSGLEVGGDSLALAAQVNGSAAAADIARMHDLPYFAGTDPADPLVFPGEHPAVLAAFPPALLVTGTRDFAASSASVMHRRLVAAGVEADLVVFDGMWHAHHVDPDLPESEEVNAILARFFRRHLGAG